ncbi:MAG: hypothetical protein HY302_09295 [Opitutae bacterium]|nr:hypothetical protein [Opitutae bacterium]
MPARAAQLNQTISGYIGILVWNYTQMPFAISAEPDSPREVRVALSCYWRGHLRAGAQKTARAAGLSVNALAEALIARDLRSAEPALVILSARGRAKPRLE